MSPTSISFSLRAVIRSRQRHQIGVVALIERRALAQCLDQVVDAAGCNFYGTCKHADRAVGLAQRTDLQALVVFRHFSVSPSVA